MALIGAHRDPMPGASAEGVKARAAALCPSKTSILANPETLRLIKADA